MRISDWSSDVALPIYVERFARQRPGCLYQSPDAAVELIVDRRRAQLVDLEAAPRIRRGNVELPRGRVAEPTHRPAHGRRRPAQRAVGVAPRGALDTLGRIIPPHRKTD